MDPWLRHDLWRAVADELLAYRAQRLERLLTEDVVRFTTARHLAAQGCDASVMRLEWPHPQLPGSRVDLVVGEPPVAAIEFKYPREPNEQNAAWTMTLGEVLKDLYRLALLPNGDRVFVYLESDRLHRYMTGAAVRYGFDLDRDDVVLEPSGAAVLPASAAQIVGPALLASRVAASRLTTIPVGQGLRLSVYVVEPAASATNQSLGPAPASRTSFRQAEERRSPLSSGSQVS